MSDTPLSPMPVVTLGRTGLKARVLGLGCGGPSRIGQTAGKSEEESIALIRKALELGVTCFDTAEAYGTETVLGKALQGTPREAFILSTKKSLRSGGELVRPEAIGPSLEQCLARLRTSVIDIFHLHSVLPEEYRYAASEVVPELLKLREQGKIRFLGLTENFKNDPQHRMLQLSHQDDCWDVLMVGFNLLNQSARERVFPAARQKNIGVINMYAVRRVLSNPARVRETMAELKRLGLLDGPIDDDDPLGFLVHEGGASSLVDAAYRFCRYQSGVHVVLSGTGNQEHLHANVASIMKPPLPEPDAERLRRMFAKVDCIAGN